MDFVSDLFSIVLKLLYKNGKWSDITSLWPADNKEYFVCKKIVEISKYSKTCDEGTP